MSRRSKVFTASYNMNWPEFFDIDGQMRELFEVQGFPTYIILGRDGTIQFFSRRELARARLRGSQRRNQP